MSGIKKEAAGELTARLARWASTPIPGTPKLLMKVRNKGELDALEGGIRAGTQKYVVDPIKQGLLKIKADKAFSTLARPFAKKEKAQAFGQKAVNMMAESPHIAIAHASPIPGAGIAMHGVERAKKWFLNKTPGLPVVKTAMANAFCDELQKIGEQKTFPGFVTDIDEATNKNTNYRKVLHTAKKEQLVAMSLPAGGDIGAEKHPHTDQFVRVEGGEGKAILNGSSRPLKNGTALVIPSGVHHNVVNTGKKPLKIYTVYSKQEHPDGIVEKTKADAHRMEKSAQVMPYQQETQWTCSVACLKAVLGHYGIEMAETDVLPYVGASEGRGAETHEIAEAARSLGLESTEYSFTDLDQAKDLLDQDVPIICDIQSFNHPGKGHYVVLTKIDEAGVHLMDPNTPGNIRILSPEEMNQRWWDRAMAPPHNMMNKWGIIVLPPV